jgi:O-antigen/teichoic acid export membrane protein
MLNLRRLKIVLRYGLVSFLTGATTFVVQSIDALMLGAWLDLESVGVYTIAFFMGSVVAMPARGVMRIATPLIADAWKHNQRSRIMNIYRSTSFLQFTAGAGILTLIWLSLPALFGFLPPVYASGAWVVTFIGLGHLIDMTGGLNTNILATSRKYAMDLYFNAGFVVIIIVTNLALIPAFGLNGAAAASLISYLMVNVIRSVYLSRAFGMQPFHSGYLRVLGSILIPAGVVYAAQPFWTGLPLLVQILLNSAIFLALNAGALWLSGAFTLIRAHLRDMKNA